MFRERCKEFKYCIWIQVFELLQCVERLRYAVVELYLIFLRREGHPDQVQLAEIRHASKHLCIEPSRFLCCLDGGVDVKSPHVSCHRVVPCEKRDGSFNSTIVTSEVNITIDDLASYGTEVVGNLGYAKLVAAGKLIEDGEPYFQRQGR